MRVLVTDGLESGALAALRRPADVDAVEADAKQLLNVIPGYEALIVRSRTKVTADVLTRGTKLRVVGRAGIGADNIDVHAAPARRIAVVKAPPARTVPAAR